MYFFNLSLEIILHFIERLLQVRLLQCNLIIRQHFCQVYIFFIPLGLKSNMDVAYCSVIKKIAWEVNKISIASL